MNRPVADTDQRIAEAAGQPIPEIFSEHGEPYFRDLESRVIRECAARTGQIISTGGGVPMRRENVDALRQNGRLILLDRPLKELIPTDDRPLADSRAKIEALWEKRMPVYRRAADRTVPVEGTPESVADAILKSDG